MAKKLSGRAANLGAYLHPKKSGGKTTLAKSPAPGNVKIVGPATSGPKIKSAPRIPGSENI